MGAFFSKTKSVRFTPDNDIPNLTGKVILVTGGTHRTFGTEAKAVESITY